jgi:hypothetical protein
MKISLIFALCVLVGTAGMAVSQTPVEPIDVEVTGLVFTFPVPGTIQLTAQLTLHNTLTSPAVYATDIEFYLDANLVATKEVVMAPSGSNCTGQDPGCSLIICDIPNGVHCTMWMTWLAGGGCDPSDPEGTCIPIEICACPLYVEIDTTSSHSGEFTATAVYDPANQVTEADETNNSLTVAIGPVPSDTRTWGAIKALFKI